MLENNKEVIKKIDEVIEYHKETIEKVGYSDHYKIALASLQFAKWILRLTDKGGLLFSHALRNKLKELMEE